MLRRKARSFWNKRTRVAMCKCAAGLSSGARPRVRPTRPQLAATGLGGSSVEPLGSLGPELRSRAAPGPTVVTSQKTPKVALRQRLGAAILPLWAVVCTVVGAALMVGHWVPLPIPDRKDPVLSRAVADLGAPSSGRWSLVHVLYAQCRCSQRTFEYLFERGKVAGVDETVVLVGKHLEYERRARASGYRLETVTRRQLKERFNVKAAPLLLVANPAGEILYSGGYTPRKQGLDYQDLAIVAKLREGANTEAIPAYGCGVSRELQSYLDPIGVKYGRLGEE